MARTKRRGRAATFGKDNKMKFSRHMPKKTPERKTWWGILFLVVWAGAVLCSVAAIIRQTPKTAYAFALFAIALAVASIHMSRKLNRIRLSRKDASICTFARALPIRDLDTWVVRATYEEIAEYVGTKKEPFPIYPTDRLKEDLGIDREDLGMMICSIADRCGRSIDGLSKDPHLTEMKTVKDLIELVTHQQQQMAEPTAAASPVVGM